MNNALIRKLRYKQGFRLPVAEDEKIWLRVSRLYFRVFELGGADCIALDIIEKSGGKKAGEIALRIGEDRSLFYLGHIGYHIDPPYQGQRFATRACRLCRELLREAGMSSVTITTDGDNLPSIRTCERLGCQLECITNVPAWCIEEFQISAQKRRYIWDLEE